MICYVLTFNYERGEFKSLIELALTHTHTRVHAHVLILSSPLSLCVSLSLLPKELVIISILARSAFG